MQYEEWEFHPTRLPTDAVEKDIAIRGLRERFMRELRYNPGVAEYLAPYDPKWAGMFLEDYADAKLRAVKYAEYHIQQARQDRELRYREWTEQAFDAILQKKLFNLQCLWRAEKIKLPGVDITWDFNYWEQNVRVCPFIEPVTEQELEVMRQFLRSDNYDIDTRSWLCSWQDYEEIKEKNTDGDYDMMPEWYEFYDGRMGTGALLELPDLRTPKERYYQKLWHEEAEQKRAAEELVNPTPPHVLPPPAIHCSIEERYKFAKAVDDEVFQEIFGEQLNDHKESNLECLPDADRAEETILMHLKRVKDPPPVRGGLPWPEAIMRCWQEYLNGVIAEDIDLVFNEYKFYIEAGIVPQPEDEEYLRAGA